MTTSAGAVGAPRRPEGSYIGCLHEAAPRPIVELLGHVETKVTHVQMRDPQLALDQVVDR